MNLKKCILQISAYLMLMGLLTSFSYGKEKVRATSPVVCETMVRQLRLEYMISQSDWDVTKKEVDDYNWRKRFAANPKNQIFFENSNKVMHESLQALSSFVFSCSADDSEDSALQNESLSRASAFDYVTSTLNAQRDRTKTSIRYEVPSPYHEETQSIIDDKSKIKTQTFGYVDETETEENFKAYLECLDVDQFEGKRLIRHAVVCQVVTMNDLVDLSQDPTAVMAKYSVENLKKTFVGPTPVGLLSEKDFIARKLEERGLYCVGHSLIGSIDKQEEATRKLAKANHATEPKTKKQKAAIAIRTL